jgi:hypothetical protein
MKLFFRSDGKRYMKVRSAGMNRKKNAKSLFFHGTENEVKFNIGDLERLYKTSIRYNDIYKIVLCKKRNNHCVKSGHNPTLYTKTTLSIYSYDGLQDHDDVWNTFPQSRL